MSGGQDYLLPAMDMAKVGGPLSVVKVFAPISNSKSTPYYFKLSTNFVGNSYIYLLSSQTNLHSFILRARSQFSRTM